MAKQPQRAPARDVAIERDLSWYAWGYGDERFAKEGLRGRNPTISTQQEVDRLAVFVDCTVQVVPSATN